MLQKFLYWTRVAVGLAQGFGFQRDVSKSQNLTISEEENMAKNLVVFI